MTNNANLYNAALSGAAAGIASRWLTNTVASSYDDQVVLITDFAVAFDALIAPAAGGGTRGEADCVESICSAFWKDRVVPDGTDMSATAAPLVALFTSLQPSILPDTGGGGGGTLTPLTGTYWVDAASALTDGTAVGNGTQGAFATIGDVATAGAGDTAVSIYIISGGYAGEGTVAFGPTPQLVNLIGVGLNVENTLPLIVAAGALCCENVQLGTGADPTVDIVANAANVRAINTIFGGKVEANGVVAERCTFLGVFVNDPTVSMVHCTFASVPPQHVNGWAMDENTFWSMMITGQQATDVIGPTDLPTISVIEFGNLKYMQDKAVTILADPATNGFVAGIAVPNNCLTATRVVTVDLTGCPDKYIFKVYATGDFTVNKLTVNGTDIDYPAQNTVFNFQNNGGVLSLISSELALLIL